MLEQVVFPPVGLDRGRLSEVMTGRTVLITGASRGIGACVAVELAAAGASLVLVARSADALDAVAEPLRRGGTHVVTHAADLRDPAQVEALLADPGLVRVDVLVSNAGHSIRRGLDDSLDRWHDVTRTVAINHLAPTQLVLGLTERLSARRGMVVNVSAANVLLPPAPGWAAYQSSKTAFDQWLRSVTPELEARGVAVGTLYLPLVRTAMSAAGPSSDSAAMSPERAAELVCRMLLERRRRHVPWWLVPVLVAEPVARPLVEAGLRASARRRRRP